MNARQDIAARLWLSVPSKDNDEAKARAEEMLDAYRAEVLAKAIGRMRAIPVDCTALTGPVWYGDGWNSAITCLEGIADYQQPDDEEYPGELQRLRATVLALRVAALRKEDLTEAQRVLNDHEDRRKKATAAAATGAPDDFFVPKRTYTRHCSRFGALRFDCRHLDNNPQTGDLEAWGWLHRENGTNRMQRLWVEDYPKWAEAGDGRG